MMMNEAPFLPNIHGATYIAAPVDPLFVAND